MPGLKQFQADGTSRQSPPNGRPAGRPVLPARNPDTTVVQFDANPSRSLGYDFARYYDGRIDAVTRACQRTIELLLKRPNCSHATFAGYCRSGVSQFLPFCQAEAAAEQRSIVLADIDRGFLERFLRHLNGRTLAVTTRRAYYTATVVLLRTMGTFSWIDDHDLYPRAVFSGIQRQRQGETPLSRNERTAVVGALKGDLAPILAGNDPLTSDELGLCMLALGLRSGINPEPLYALSADCLQPHPIKADRKLLLSRKRRGNTTRVLALRAHWPVEQMTTVTPDIVAVIDTVHRRQAPLRAASARHRDDLFVYIARDARTKGSITRMDSASCYRAIAQWTRRHGLTADDGRPLSLNLMRLRKTFVNRIWQLSGQDPWVTAKLGGHRVKVSERYYLEAPPEAEKEFAFLGEIRTRELLQSAVVPPAQNTPVSKCRDHGRDPRRPRGGDEHCTDFLACVRCRSFVVTEDDLHRLYSFYWLLVRERERIGARRWSRYFGHIVRIIDAEIAPCFPPASIERARQQAQVTPHPYWRDPVVLEDALA